MKTFQVKPTHAPAVVASAVSAVAAVEAVVSGLGTGPAPPPAPAPGTVPVTGSSDADGRPDLLKVIVAYGVVALTSVVTLRLTTDFPYSATPVTPVAGVTIFAVFFVAAQGVERLLEPIASLLQNDSRDGLAAAAADAQTKVDRAQALAVRGSADPAFMAASAAAQAALDEAAARKAAHQRSQANRTVAFWAIASSVSIVAAAVLKLYLLTTVGVASPGRVLDVIATGLIIGAGTKPLHDLVGLITAQKESATTR